MISTLLKRALPWYNKKHQWTKTNCPLMVKVVKMFIYKNLIQNEGSMYSKN